MGLEGWFDVPWSVYRALKCNSRYALAVKIVHAYWQLLTERAVRGGEVLQIYGTTAKIFVGRSPEARQRRFLGLDPMYRIRKVVRPTLWVVKRKGFYWKRRQVLIPNGLYRQMFDLALDHAYAGHDFTDVGAARALSTGDVRNEVTRMFPAVGRANIGRLLQRFNKQVLDHAVRNGDVDIGKGMGLVEFRYRPAPPDFSKRAERAHKNIKFRK